MPAAPRLIFFRLPSRAEDQPTSAPPLNTTPLPIHGLASCTMLCLRCRALPSIRTPVSSIRTPMNRCATQLSAASNRVHQKTNQTSIQRNRIAQPSTPRISNSNSTSRPFSSLLSTPTRLQPTQTPSLPSRLPSTSTSTPLSLSVSSVLAQQSQQTRSFSATASLGVRRVTFRPSRRVQKRRHGFLSRNNDRKGRQTLTRRRVKGRKNMSW